MNGDEWKGTIRALIYPIQFSERPAAEVERVLDVLDYPGSPWDADLPD